MTFSDIFAINYIPLLAMDKFNYPVKAVFIPGQRGTEVLLDPLNNKMSKKSNEANGKAIYECSKKRGEGRVGSGEGGQDDLVGVDVQ